MIDDADLPARRTRDGEDLLYDFFKHMTSLSLVTLGGALTISQMPAMDIRPFSLGMVVVMLAVAGVAGFAGMDEIVKARLDSKDATGRVGFYRKVCPATFGIGVGAFLSLFFRAL